MGLAPGDSLNRIIVIAVAGSITLAALLGLLLFKVFA